MQSIQLEYSDRQRFLTAFLLFSCFLFFSLFIPGRSLVTFLSVFAILSKCLKLSWSYIRMSLIFLYFLTKGSQCSVEDGWRHYRRPTGVALLCIDGAGFSSMGNNKSHKAYGWVTVPFLYISFADILRNNYFHQAFRWYMARDMNVKVKRMKVESLRSEKVKLNFQ